MFFACLAYKQELHSTILLKKSQFHQTSQICDNYPLRVKPSFRMILGTVNTYNSTVQCQISVDQAYLLPPITNNLKKQKTLYKTPHINSYDVHFGHYIECIGLILITPRSPVQEQVALEKTRLSGQSQPSLAGPLFFLWRSREVPLSFLCETQWD